MGSYVEKVLSENEKIEYVGKVSLWSLMTLVVIGNVLLPFYGVGLIFLGMALIKYLTTELVITNKKVIAKFGFISRSTIELLLPKVESIQVDQSILGRMLNYGSIIVAGAGNPKAPIPGISNPLMFRTKFMEIQERVGAGGE